MVYGAGLPLRWNVRSQGGNSLGCELVQRRRRLRIDLALECDEHRHKLLLVANEHHVADKRHLVLHALRKARGTQRSYCELENLNRCLPVKETQARYCKKRSDRSIVSLFLSLLICSFLRLSSFMINIQLSLGSLIYTFITNFCLYYTCRVLPRQQSCNRKLASAVSLYLCLCLRCVSASVTVTVSLFPSLSLCLAIAVKTAIQISSSPANALTPTYNLNLNANPNSKADPNVSFSSCCMQAGRTSSIGTGATFSPPAVIMSSLMRPVM